MKNTTAIIFRIDVVQNILNHALAGAEHYLRMDLSEEAHQQCLITKKALTVAHDMVTYIESGRKSPLLESIFEDMKEAEND